MMQAKIHKLVKHLHMNTSEDTYFDLLELGIESLPFLIDAFQSEVDEQIAATLLEVICQYRNSNTVELLAQCLHDSRDAVWKAALDGLVSIGGKQALLALERESPRLSPAQVQWVDEAIQQIMMQDE